jgi:hypothetical protein
LLDERLYKKCFKRWLSLLHSPQLGAEERRELYELLMGDLKQYRLSLNKVNYLMNILANETAIYERETESIGEQIQQRSEDIVRLKEQLEYEKQQREYRLQYDGIARTILEYPSKEDTTRETNVLKETIETLKEEQEKAVKRYESQKKRLQHLLNVLDEVDDAIGTQKLDELEEGAIVEHEGNHHSDVMMREINKESSFEEEREGEEEVEESPEEDHRAISHQDSDVPMPPL